MFVIHHKIFPFKQILLHVLEVYNTMQRDTWITCYYGGTNLE